MVDAWRGLALGQSPRHLQGPEDHSKATGQVLPPSLFGRQEGPGEA